MTNFFFDPDGSPKIRVSYCDNPILDIQLGYELKGFPPVRTGLEIKKFHSALKEEKYSIPVGKTEASNSKYREEIYSFRSSENHRLQFDVILRLYDEGLAYRYSFKKTEALSQLNLLAENSEFRFHSDPYSYYLPLKNFTTSYEAHYREGQLSKIDDSTLIALPVLFEVPETQGSTWVSITEAELFDYAGMYLRPQKHARGVSLKSVLSPLPGREDGLKVEATLPHSSPWRVMFISDQPSDFLESNLIFDLNAPSKIKDPSWIRPGKTTFPWWNNYVLKNVDFKPGLNTQHHKHYIDFCSEQGIEYHSLDGTDKAWYGGPINPKGPTDITTGIEGLDVAEVFRYAKEKGIRMRVWMHWKALKTQIDEALALYQKWGAEGIMVDFMDRDDQEMVNFYHEIAEKAARHQLTVTFHGSYKPTGMERTWPNVLSYESVLNQEYNKWDPVGTTATHNLYSAMIRMIAGPLDYHQGGVRSVLKENYKPKYTAPPVQGTRAHQLAQYVIYQNHLPMMVDFPSAYRGQKDLNFLAKIPSNWHETRVLYWQIPSLRKPASEQKAPGIIIARRFQQTWYVGGLAGDQPLNLDLPLNFLSPGKYNSTLIEDRPGSDPNEVNIRSNIPNSKTYDGLLKLSLRSQGGFVGRWEVVDS